MSDVDSTYWDVLTRLLGTGPVSTVVDVGANRGDMAARFAQAFPQARVVAVEPNPEIFAGLRARFNGEPRVECVNVALGAATGEADFHVNRIDATSSLFPRVREARRYFAAGDTSMRTLRVPVRTFDELAERHGLSHIDLLKLDTQGAELSIFQGARRLLAAQAIDVIYSEFFVVPHYEDAPLLHEQWSFLAGFGYLLFDLFKGPHGRNGQLRFGDAIIVSDSFRRERLDIVPPED